MKTKSKNKRTTTKRASLNWLNRFVSMINAENRKIKNENKKLRSLVDRMYKWTHCKDSEWAKEARKVLDNYDR